MIYLCALELSILRHLTLSGDWKDMGTAHVVYDESPEHFEFKILSESSNTELLSHSVDRLVNYERQGDTIILWRDRQVEREYAISFQEAQWCAEVYYHITNSKKPPGPTVRTLPDLLPMFCLHFVFLILASEVHVVSNRAGLSGSAGADHGQSRQASELL